MRGTETKQSSYFSLESPETRVPDKHPIRAILRLANAALSRLGPTFDAMYSTEGRPSIPPERLLKASLLMALYTVRSERLFCEQLGYNLLFRYFLEMDMVEEGFDASTFSKNRRRLLKHEVAGKFFASVVVEARRAGLMSDDHFTVDGTLIEAWASLKSFKHKERANDKPPDDDPGNPTVDFHGEKRSNETHESTTDPEARLMRKGSGKEAKLSFSQNVLMENRSGLIVDVKVEKATGTAERTTALDMLKRAVASGRRATVAGDKGYDTRDFVQRCRGLGVTPHVAQNEHARHPSAIDGRTTRHPGYTISQRIRKRVEEVFGWCKTIGNFRKTRYKGVERTQMASYVIGAAYNLLRIARATPQPA